MNADGGTITWYLTAHDADFQAVATRVRREARRTGRDVDREFGRGFKNAGLSLDDFRRDLNKSAQLFRDFQIALRGFEMTSIILGATLAGGAIIELVGALTAAVGTIVAFPGLIAPALGAFGAIKVATVGLSDAFKALGKGDAEKLAEALAKLSPAAQEFVLSAGRIKEAFKPIQDIVQENFFKGLGKQMEAVAATSFPVLQTGLGNISTAINGLIVEAGRVMQQPFFQKALADTLNTTAQATSTLTGAVDPLARAVTGLIQVGLPYTNMLAEWVVKQSQVAAEYINSAAGQQALTDTINLGIDALQKLGDLVFSVSKLFISLFKVSNQEGLSLIDSLIKIVDATNDWVNSAEGQELLTALFEATNEVFLELAETLGELLVGILKIIKAYNDLDGPLKDVITSAIVWSALLSPIISYMSAIAASSRLVWELGTEAFQAVALSIKATKRVVEGYKLALAGVPPLQAAVEGGTFAKLGAQLQGVVTVLSKMPAALRVGVGAIPAIFSGALAAVPGVIAAAGSAIMSAFYAIPIVGWIALIVTALVGLFAYFYTTSEDFRNFINGIVSGIGSAVGGLVDTVKLLFSGDFTGKGLFGLTEDSPFVNVILTIRETVIGAFTSVVNFFKTAGETIGNIFSTIAKTITDVVTVVLNILNPLFQIIGLIGYAIAGFGQIVFTIFSAIGQVIFTIVSTIIQIIGVILYGTILKLGELFTFIFNNIVAVVTVVMNTIASVITEVWNGIVAFLTPILTAIGDFFTTIFTAIQTAVVTTFTAIWTFIQPVVTQIAAVITTVFTAVAGVVNTLFNLIRAYIINPVADAVAFVGRTIGQIATSIGNAVRDAYNAVANFVGRFTEAGRNIIDGIVNGIKGGAGAVVNTVKNIAANALDAVKKFFGIKSPSKVMAKMGGYVMEGFQLGIADMGRPVVSAAESTAQSVVDAFSGISSRIGSIQSDFSVTGSSVMSTQFAPAVMDTANSELTSASGVTINQTNEVYTDLDMEQVNRNLTWELGKL